MPIPSQNGTSRNGASEGAKTPVAELAERRRRATSPLERRRLLTDLIERYEESDEEAAEALRQAFLLTLQEAPNVLIDEAFIDFLVEHVKPEDLAALSWEMPAHVVDFSEMLYNAPERLGEAASDEAARTDALREKLTGHVHHLLSQALHQFEARGEMEKVFQLLQIAPATLATSEAEALRLRNRAYLHELRRVQRNRRILYGYLLLQAVLITAVFPLLFINAENGHLQEGIEDATGVEVESTERQYLSYGDGLYWSFITAGSIGYGDITPETGMGRVIASILGVMGVITVGVIAGLILSWVTPRQLS